MRLGGLNAESAMAITLKAGAVFRGFYPLWPARSALKATVQEGGSRVTNARRGFGRYAGQVGGWGGSTRARTRLFLLSILKNLERPGNRATLGFAGGIGRTHATYCPLIGRMEATYRSGGSK